MGIFDGMQLAAFMNEEKLDDAAMAEKLGADVSAWAVRKWRYGQRVPRQAMQKRILSVSGGRVTPNDLFAAAEAAKASPANPKPCSSTLRASA